MVLADSLRFQKPTNAKPETVMGKFMKQNLNGGRHTREPPLFYYDSS